MNNFLQTRADVDAATKYLNENNLEPSGLDCKNWEIREVIPYLTDGNILDMGSDGGVVIPNAIKLNLKGQKVGIDLAYKENKSENGADFIKGDLSNVPFPDGFFNIITCLSVVEHEVNFQKLAKEVSRLLTKGGKLYLSCDFWEPKPDTSKMRLYSLSWNILNKDDLVSLILALGENMLALASVIDWTLKDAVIDEHFCSPALGVAYTFGIFEFIKA